MSDHRPGPGARRGGLVSLPMYDLGEVATATRTILGAIADGLTAAGWVARPHVEPIGDHRDLLAHWRDPSLALSQSCALPYGEALSDAVAVVGTFRWSDVVDDRGRYRSVVVAREGAWPDGARSPVRPAVNDPGSLSGWCSLGVAMAGLGVDRDQVGPMLVSGSHAASLALVRRGGADVASIDAVTHRLLERHRPAALSGLQVVGRGPVVAATPLITRRDAPLTVEVVRACVRRAVDDAACAAARASLGIDGFVDLDDDDVAAVLALVEQANAWLPRERACPDRDPDGSISSAPADR